jgi:hypothetical protein
MRGLLLLTFALISTAGRAQEWVVLRPPPESGTLPAGILVDSSSIEILDTGIRRARNHKWSPMPENRAADLTVDFVCGWKPK